MNYISYDIEKLLKDLHIISKCRVAYFDRNYKEIFAFPSRLCEFCKSARKISQLNDRCRMSDYSAFKRCEADKKIVIYKCHLGLTEAINPIIINDTIEGYVMLGQVRGEDSFDISEINLALSEFNQSFKSYSFHYEELPFIDREKMYSIVNVAGFCLHNAINTYINQDKGNTLKNRIDKYIYDNIDKNIDIPTLCQEIGYKKTNFYKVTKSIYGITIASHIRKIKVQKAKELLLQTNLKINEISTLVGEYDYNHFTKLFKTEVNCTPREYRKNNLEMYIDE